MTSRLVRCLPARRARRLRQHQETSPPQLDAVSTPGTAFGNTLLARAKRLELRLRNSDAGLPKVKPLESIITITGADLTFSHGCPAQLKEGRGYVPRSTTSRTAAGTLAGELRDQQRRCARAAAVRQRRWRRWLRRIGVVAFSGSVDGNFGTVARGATRRSPTWCRTSATPPMRSP